MDGGGRFLGSLSARLFAPLASQGLGYDRGRPPAGHERPRAPRRQAPHDWLGRSPAAGQHDPRRADRHALEPGDRRGDGIGCSGLAVAQELQASLELVEQDRAQGQLGGGGCLRWRRVSPRERGEHVGSLAPAIDGGRSAAFTPPLRSLPVAMWTRRILPP